MYILIHFVRFIFHHHEEESFFSMTVKFLSFRFACVCSPERGNQPGAISFTLITFYYYEPQRREGVRTVFRTFISRRRKSAPGVAPRILVLLVVLVIERALEGRALSRARLAIHSRARLLLSRWRGPRTRLTGMAAR